jgi:hypothetical protein
MRKHQAEVPLSSSKQRKADVLKDSDFPIPNKVSRIALQELLEAHGFTVAETIVMSARLDALVEEYSTHMREQHGLRPAIDDKKNLKESVKKISDAIWHLNGCGPIGRQIARSGTSSLGEMLTVSWLRNAFPDADDLPSRESPDAGGIRTISARSTPVRLRSKPVYIEERTREARYYFAREHSLSLIGAVLREIESSLNEALRLSKSPGGRNPCKFRHYFIINLAVIWKEIGRDIRGTGPFAFPQFCEHIFEAIGWRVDGIKRAIDKALADPVAGF